MTENTENSKMISRMFAAYALVTGIYGKSWEEVDRKEVGRVKRQYAYMEGLKGKEAVCDRQR